MQYITVDYFSFAWKTCKLNEYRGEQMKLDYKKIGKRVKKRRKELAMTQERLAEHCDVSSTYISHIETGIANISLEVLYRVSIALQTTPDYFLMDTIKSPVYITGELSALLEKCNPKTLYTVGKLVETLVSIQNED